MSRASLFGSASLRLACATALVGALSLCAPLAPADADGARIVVDVHQLRSSDGSVRGALFAARDGWAQEGREIATCRARIHALQAACVFRDVPPGTYAVAFLHDEDDDGALDRNWIGIPDEGFGFSNDAAPGFGPPSYESASFDHRGPETALTVHARYGL